MEAIRLQKYISDCGVCSRRAAEAAIEKGRVTVDGLPATIGQKIDPDRQTVTFDGVPVRRAGDERHYLLFNKPRGVVTTLSDEKGRRSVLDYVGDLPYRVYPVGRLDMYSDGLLLLTDDGDLTAFLTHPSHEIDKRYRVTVAGTVDAATLARLRQPFLLDDYTTRPAAVTVEEINEKETVLCLVIHEGRNRQIRRMCRAVGLTVLRLTRTALGSLLLGDLPAGQYRSLTADEIAYIKGKEQESHDRRQTH